MPGEELLALARAPAHYHTHGTQYKLQTESRFPCRCIGGVLKNGFGSRMCPDPLRASMVKVARQPCSLVLFLTVHKQALGWTEQCITAHGVYRVTVMNMSP